MAFLTLGGTIDLDVTDIVESEPERIGDESRSSSGVLRGVYTAEKRKWTMTLLEMSNADYEAVRSLLAFGAQVSAAGDFLPTPTTVRGYVKGSGYIRNGVSFLRDVKLEIVEV